MASDLDLVKLWTYLRWRNPAPRSRIKIFQISFQNISKNLKKKFQNQNQIKLDPTRTRIYGWFY